MINPCLFNTTDTTFATDVLQSPTPVLVDFWGEWCGPCKALAPLLEQLAEQYGGHLKIAQVDLSAPTMLLLKGGQVQATQMGLVSKSQLTKVIDAAL